MASENNSTQILHDFSPLIRVYKDGRIERIDMDEFVPPSLDPNPETNARTKDVIISPEFSVSARLYLPTVVPGEKIPLLVYFHGGGFVIGSTFSATYQNHLHSLALQAHALIVSVDYRLAPENPLPAAYEDSWLAVKWVASGDPRPEEWIRDYADLGQVYFGGDSAGGNIAHNMALRIGVERLNKVNLKGIFLNCPYFWGKDPIGNEAEREGEKRFLDDLWPFVYPGSGGLDDPYLNPSRDPDLARLGCLRVAVLVGGEDVLKGRGWLYKEALERSGWGGEVKVVEVDGEGHVFCLFSHASEKTIAMIKKLACFLNNGDFHA